MDRDKCVCLELVGDLSAFAQAYENVCIASKRKFNIRIIFQQLSDLQHRCKVDVLFFDSSYTNCARVVIPMTGINHQFLFLRHTVPPFRVYALL
ncbi:hypothetical protein D3C74_364800 [compost metagenome]